MEARMGNNSRNAVKAFIINDGKVLLIKRRSNDIHKPGGWDIPGGRLELNEDPYTGLIREVKEEVQLEIEILFPIDIHYFTRDDGQQVTLMIFCCKPLSTKVTLSEEHTEYRWHSLDTPLEDFPDWLQAPVKKFKTYVNMETLAKEI
jgi:8-oxo-dGTP diphosphatase